MFHQNLCDLLKRHRLRIHTKGILGAQFRVNPQHTDLSDDVMCNQKSKISVNPTNNHFIVIH